MSYERLTVEESIAIEKRRREEEHARNVAQAPQPQPRPVEEMSPSEHDLRWPPQSITILTPPPRTADGSIPQVSSASEADKLRDPAFLLKRIDGLEQRIAWLEDIAKRQYSGGALNTDGKVYR